MFTNNGSTLQTDITTFGVNMKLAHLGRQALMGVMAVALVAGMSVKSFADEGLLNKVKERGTLLVGLEGTYPPFSFQGDDGKLTGFEVEFAQQLAKHLGVEASLKPTKWDGMLASLDSKRIDVVINQVTISDERKKKYDFSTPYTISGIQALVKKGNEGTIKTAADLKGKKVAHTSPSSNSGHLAPLALMPGQGLAPGKDYEIKFSGKHDQSILGVGTGDYDAARELVESYAVKVDPELHAEVLERYKKLNLAPYKGFVNPKYEAVTDADGNITDVKVTYDEGYAEQMLRYSKDYSALPSVND